MRSTLKHPVVYLVLVLVAIGTTTGPVPMANAGATAATATLPTMACYSSAPYSYTLPLPAGWTLIPDVRWLPLSPASTRSPSAR